MFISWHNILITKNITLKKSCRICELHFTPEDIIREDAFPQVDGTIIYLKRKNPKLIEGAVPSIFPIKKNISYCQYLKYKNNSDDISCELLTDCETSEITQTEEPIPSTSINKTLQIENRSFVPRKETKFSAEAINIAKNIEVPSSWFANINDNSMMWTCWTNNLSYILRRVVLRTNMEIQVNI